MTPKQRKDMFKVLEGKTIAKVNASSINVVTLTMEDGTKVRLDCDEQHFGIAVIQAEVV